MAVILDTNLLTILHKEIPPECDHLLNRLHMVAASDVYTTVISLEEQMRGWLGEINSAKKPERLLRAYHELLITLEQFCGMKILPFDQVALDRFQDLRGQRVRISTLDLRIAGIALSRGDMVLTRNLRHFRQVPDLLVEDWTQPELPRSPSLVQ